MDIQKSIKQLPLTSGVYLMKDAGGKIIYIGKAISLRKRVQSYFTRKTDVFSKTDLLVPQIASIDYIPTQSEAEALILEASLIKTYKPKFNIDLRDDKSYPFIEVTKERFPRIAVVRPKATKNKERGAKKTPVARLYGPYVDAGLIREALKIIRRIFPFRSCDPFPERACLYYHIDLCPGPCIKKITAQAYRCNIKNVCLILEGKKDRLYNSLKKEMEARARKKEFEEAAAVRDQIRAIGALYSGTKDVNYFKEAEQLQRVLNLPRRPERIEAFDISNLMGKQAVGSMISFVNGKPDKKNYRRFRIKEVQGIDDFKMMGEVVRRRYSRLQREGRAYPDLIIIDGGKGQISAAKKELETLGVVIPLMAIAKREEKIYLPQKKNPVVLAKDSLGLKLIQRVRDEAHRFAINYHRKLRKKHFEKALM